MNTVRDVLKNKGHEVWSITPETTLLEALQTLRDKDVGALLVMDGENLAGIVSERDFVRYIARTGYCLLHGAVKEYMTKDVFTVDIDASLDECMAMMTQHHIRHLPVKEQTHLSGMISIGDIVKQTISAKDQEIHSLENYITGTGFGR